MDTKQSDDELVVLKDKQVEIEVQDAEVAHALELAKKQVSDATSIATTGEQRKESPLSIRQ